MTKIVSSPLGDWYGHNSVGTNIVTTVFNGTIYSVDKYGLVYGSYTWNSANNQFSGNNILNTTDGPGLPAINKVTVTGSTLTTSSTTSPSHYDATFTSVPSPQTPTSIIGCWIDNTIGSNNLTEIISFLPNGQMYIGAQGNNQGQPFGGAEIAAYTWNPATGQLSVGAPQINTLAQFGVGLTGKVHIALNGNQATINSGAFSLVSATPAPMVSTVGYDAATGKLTLAGSNFTTKVSDYKVTDFSLAGDGYPAYTLTSGSTVLASTLSSTNVTLQLSVADQLAVAGLLNNNGTKAYNGTPYNLATNASWWDTGASAFTTQAVNVSNVVAPTITNVAYNAVTGVFTFSGSHLDNRGTSNGLALGHFTLSGGSNGSYTFNPAQDKVTNFSANGFTVTLSNTDHNSVNAIVNDNGNFAANGSAYNLTSPFNWDGHNSSPIKNQGITVNGAGSVNVIATINDNVHGLAFDQSGDLYFAGINNYQLYELTPGNSTVQTVISSGALDTPMGIAIGGNGDIYVTNNDHASIAVIPPGSNSASYYISTGTGSGPLGIVFDNSGDLYYVDNNSNSIKEILAADIQGQNPNPIPEAILSTGLKSPHDIAIDNAGDLFIADTGNNAIKEIPFGSHSAITLLGTGLSLPRGVAVDSYGNVYIGDSGHNAVKELPANSHTPVTLLGSGLNAVKGLSVALDSNGNLYTTDSSNHAVKEIYHSNYLFNSPLATQTPVTITNLWENTRQIELSKSIYSAFSAESNLSSTDFSNFAGLHGKTSLFYDTQNGGLYYEAPGATAPVEIAVVGVSSHPATLSLGDFKLVA